MMCIAQMWEVAALDVWRVTGLIATFKTWSNFSAHVLATVKVELNKRYSRKASSASGVLTFKSKTSTVSSAPIITVFVDGFEIGSVLFLDNLGHMTTTWCTAMNGVFQKELAFSRSQTNKTMKLYVVCRDSEKAKSSIKLLDKIDAATQSANVKASGGIILCDTKTCMDAGSLELLTIGTGTLGSFTAKSFVNLIFQANSNIGDPFESNVSPRIIVAAVHALVEAESDSASGASFIDARTVCAARYLIKGTTTEDLEVDVTLVGSPTTEKKHQKRYGDAKDGMIGDLKVFYHHDPCDVTHAQSMAAAQARADSKHKKALDQFTLHEIYKELDNAKKGEWENGMMKVWETIDEERRELLGDFRDSMTTPSMMLIWERLAAIPDFSLFAKAAVHKSFMQGKGAAGLHSILANGSSVVSLLGNFLLLTKERNVKASVPLTATLLDIMHLITERACLTSSFFGAALTAPYNSGTLQKVIRLLGLISHSTQQQRQQLVKAGDTVEEKAAVKMAVVGKIAGAISRIINSKKVVGNPSHLRFPPFGIPDMIALHGVQALAPFAMHAVEQKASLLLASSHFEQSRELLTPSQTVFVDVLLKCAAKLPLQKLICSKELKTKMKEAFDEQSVLNTPFSGSISELM